MRILFLGINFHGEGCIHGENTVNGYTKYADNIVDELSELAEIVVATDQPERYIERGIDAVNVYRSTVTDITNISNFWRESFPVKTRDEEEFSRDTIYKLIHLANTLDFQKLRELETTDYFDYVFLNRHECFFIEEFGLFQKAKFVHIAQDSQYLRRLSYQNHYDIEQPLASIEQAVEKSLIMRSERILSISPEEAEYFSSLSKDESDVFLYRPKIKKPIKIINLLKCNRIKVYFLGVNNFVNRQTLALSIKMLELVLDKKSFEFHVVGSVCNMLKDVESTFDIIAHGRVENLSNVVADFDLLLAPVELGSGAPIKIADALSNGHYVISTSLGATAYSEFIDERVFIGEDIEKLFNIIRKKEKEKKNEASSSVYDDYINKNKDELKRLLKK